MIAQHLHLDVVQLGEIFLQQNVVAAKGGASFTLGCLDGLAQRVRGPDDAHPFAATPGAGFDQHRIAHFLRRLLQFSQAFAGAVYPGNNRHASLLGDFARLRLAAHRFDGRCCGADEGQSLGDTGSGERGVLAQEAVTGMDRFGPGPRRYL